MTGPSRISEILDHLAWLADRINDGSNRGRGYDAALLTYNAAAVLQWCFVASVNSADTIHDAVARAESAQLIDNLVIASRRLAMKAKSSAVPGQDVDIRTRLVKEIGRVLKNLPQLMAAPLPIPIRKDELEAAVSIPALIDEFIAVNKKDHPEAIARGWAVGAKGGTGPEASLNEAIATLICVHGADNEASRTPELRRGLARIAAGFFKTAVGMQPDDISPEQKKRLQRLADSLVASAEETTSI